MKSWKDPIIFGAISGSGRFKIKRPVTGKIEGLSRYTLKIKDRKLIARHVRSLTDGEFKKWIKLSYKNHVEVGRLESPESFLYLLSIGVLPESLADEDVIWEGKDD